MSEQPGATPDTRPARAPGPTGAFAPRSARDRAGVVALLLLGLLLVQGILFIRESSQTSDEAIHLAAGYAYLRARDFSLNPEHPPLIKELAALPLLVLALEAPGRPAAGQAEAEQGEIGRAFLHRNRLPAGTLLRWGRLPVLLLSLLLGWAIFRWGRDLFGARAGLLGLSLYVLDPNVVAHSGLVTTDLGVTLFMFLSIESLWRWSRRPSPGRLALAALAIGGAFASKFTALWLVPIVAALGFILIEIGASIPARPWSSRSPGLGGASAVASRVAGLVLAGLLTAAIAALVVAASYAGRALPSYATGLGLGLGHAAGGHPAFLMGTTSMHGWWYYFLVAYVIKTPIGTLVLIAISLVALGAGARRDFADEVFLWIPIGTILVITCLVSVNIGLRHLLPMYPFLHLSTGRIAALPPIAPGLRRALVLVVAGCLVWNAAEAAAIAPYDLAYFNQLVGGPRQGYRYLVDSNLDWGQAAGALRRCVESLGRPVIYCAYSTGSDPGDDGVRYQFLPGTWNLPAAALRSEPVPDGQPREILAVSASALYADGPTGRPLYDWLRPRPAIARPGYAYLVYDITGDAKAHAHLALVYLETDHPAPAETEARRALRIDPDNPMARQVLERARSRPGAAPRPER